MKLVKRLTAVALMACIAVTGTFAFVVTPEKSAAISEQKLDVEVEPRYDYEKKTHIREYDGNYTGDSFEAKYTGSVNVWFENQGETDVTVELWKVSLFGDKEVGSMSVEPNKSGGRHFSADVTKGTSYYVKIYTDRGEEIDGYLKVRDPKN